MTAVKICGIRERDDAKAALDAGADYLGFVFEPSSVRYVGALDWCPDWLADLPIPKVAVYGRYTSPVPSGFDYVQAVEWPMIPPEDLRHLYAFRPDEEGAAFAATLRAGDAILLDSYSPVAFGGTGERLDWGLAARMVARLQGFRVFLAGGLHESNVREAIQAVSPFGVDVSSGVESAPGIKDHRKIAQFIASVKTSG